MTYKLKHIFESCYNVVANAFIGWLVFPLASFNPNGVASETVGRNNVLAIGVAYYQYFRGGQIESAHSESEYGRIGFAHAYHSRLNNLLEETIEMSVAQHCADVAVEVGYEHHRQTCLTQTFEHLAVFV